MRFRDTGSTGEIRTLASIQVRFGLVLLGTSLIPLAIAIFMNLFARSILRIDLQYTMRADLLRMVTHRHIRKSVNDQNLPEIIFQYSRLNSSPDKSLHPRKDSSPEELVVLPSDDEPRAAAGEWVLRQLAEGRIIYAVPESALLNAPMDELLKNPDISVRVLKSTRNGEQ
jgi:hypothetical protein